MDALLAKLQADEPITTPERRQLAGIVQSFAHIVELVAAGQTARIAPLLGMRGPRREGMDSASEEPSTSPTSVADDAPTVHAPETKTSSAPEPRTLARDEHGRRAAAGFERLQTAHHQHTLLHPGESCPSCRAGRVYKYRPDEFTTVSGQAPLVATRHTVDTLRCNSCLAVFKAPIPESWTDDGVEERTLYTHSAVAMVVYYRFFAGVPMHRQDRLQRALGVPVPDASIWDMCERFADVATHVVRVLSRLASDAPLFYGDDTGATILDTRSKVKKRRGSDKEDRRTGCHTTCVIAVTADDHAISLFNTGIHHTGEVMDALVEDRQDGLHPPLFMGDCVSSNVITTAVVIYAGCNAHAVRRFKALADRYPEQAGAVLEHYGAIYANEDHCRASGLVGEARRDYHEQHSRPHLRTICELGEDLIEARKMEPNSDLAAAFSYVRENERRLSAFTRHPGAPLDNNRCERELKLCIQLRDTARFFRNTIGSGVADSILTLGATASAAGVNLPEYFATLLRNRADVRAHPEDWLPWRYRERPPPLLE